MVSVSIPFKSWYEMLQGLLEQGYNLKSLGMEGRGKGMRASIGDVRLHPS